MNRILFIALVTSLLNSTVVVAQTDFPNRSTQGNSEQGRQGGNDQNRRGNDNQRSGSNDTGRQGNSDQNRSENGSQSRYEGYRNDPGVHMTMPRYSRGDRVPDAYRNNQQYVVDDWQQRHLRRPPRGYHWVRDDDGNYFLAAITTGVILDLLLNAGR